MGGVTYLTHEEYAKLLNKLAAAEARIAQLSEEVEALRVRSDDPDHAKMVLYAQAQKFLGDPLTSVTISTLPEPPAERTDE